MGAIALRVGRRRASLSSAIGLRLSGLARGRTLLKPTLLGEFQVMKNPVALCEALRYQLQMFGVPIDGAMNVFCNNKAVYKNTLLPESTRKKKHDAIAYHRCREAVAAGTVRVAKEGTRTNLSDLFTKVLPQLRREELLDKFTFYVKLLMVQ